MSNYLVTGGSGFIGSHLVNTLVSQNHTVTVLDESIPTTNGSSDATYLKGSIMDYPLLCELMRTCEGCFHLGAIANAQKTIENWRETHLINGLGTINVFAAIHENKRTLPVVYASSAAAYGGANHFPLSEKAHPKPLTPYGVDKLSDEFYGRIDTLHYQIPNIGLR